VYGSFLALKRAHLPDLPRGQPIYIGGQPLNLSVEAVLPLTALGVSLVLAAAVGATAKRNTDASNRPSAKGIGTRENYSVASPSIGFHVSLTASGYCGLFPPGSMVVLAKLSWSELIHCAVHFLRGGFAVSVHNSAPSCSFLPC
jgi:hypothetical protein